MICACYRHTNKVVVIHSYQLYGVRLEGFHSWQRVFFLYLYPFVPDGAEKDCIEIPCLLCGDRGYFSKFPTKIFLPSLTLNKGRRLWGRFRKKRYVAKKGFSAQISKLSGETFHF